jgi:hypothetical protein
MLLKEKDMTDVAGEPARIEQQLARVRQICLALAETSERLSHGEPTFFVDNVDSR